MKRSRGLRCLTVAGLIAIISPVLMGAQVALAGVIVEGTQTIPLPVSVEDSFYVEVLGNGVYTPSLTKGEVTLNYSIIGQGGDLVAESDFDCTKESTSQPRDPVLRLVLTGAQGSLNAGVTISGTMRNQTSGDYESYTQSESVGPLAVVETSDTQILKICREADSPSNENTPPQASFASSCSGLTCSFADTSSDPDGTVSAWEWSFGDGGGAAEQNPSHSYPAPGTYQVTLTVTDDRGSTAAATASVKLELPNTAPEASFEASCIDLICSFTDTSSDPDGSVTAWEWNFGDGTSSTEQSPSRSYPAAGTYHVSLTVTDDRGGTGIATATKSVYAPVTITTTSVPDGKKNQPYSYTLVAAGGEPSYSWGLVSGSLPAGLSLSSAGTISGKPRPGTYSFVVSVTDARGRSATATLSIAIAPR